MKCPALDYETVILCNIFIKENEGVVMSHAICSKAVVSTYAIILRYKMIISCFPVCCKSAMYNCSSVALT